MEITRQLQTIAICLITCLCLGGPALAAAPTVTIKGTSKTFRYNGASGSIKFTVTGAPKEQVTVDAVSKDASWIAIDPLSQNQTFTLNAKGKASGSVKYRVDLYEASSPSPRQGTIGIGTSSFTVYQTGMPCSVSIEPSKASFAKTGGNGSVTVKAPEGCGWSASIASPTPWLTFSGSATGSGPATLTYAVAPNESSKGRSSKITVSTASGKGKKTHNVAQSGESSISTGSGYVVFAWNDLGMHCLNPTYDDFVILPPYNTVWAQVVQKGNPPQIVTSGVTVDYRIINNTFSYGKQSYGQFWDNMQALFGTTLPHDKGLNLEDPLVNNGLSGTMLAKGDHFQANGIPVTPVEDGGTWNPYQVAEVTVRDAATGQLLAQTRATVPTSDEIHCDGCHGAGVAPVLTAHDNLSGTSLQNQKPVLCASCHASPALGSPGKPGVKYLSEAIHSFHGKLANQPTCYNCHPGASTKCNRSLRHTSEDGNCTACHGTLAQVGSSITAGRVPWASEPNCSSCHGGTTIPQVDTGTTLYRNAKGHGGMSCAACHGSPHAMVPSRVASDNYQAIAYQGKAVSIGSCAVCHSNSRGAGSSEFAEEHGGTNPKHANACHVCHTAVPSTPALWPHSYKWNAR
jgi:hypothetical protein